MSVRRSRPLVAVAPAAALAVGLAACGGTSTAGSSGTPPIAPGSSGSTSAPDNPYSPPVAASSGGSGTGVAATVAVANNPKLGKILVDAGGRTLYLFKKDSKGTSACSGSCAQVWPPLSTNGSPQAGPGASAALIGTTRRADGKTEVTYDGHPLYTYQGDSKPGDTTGENVDQFGAEWYVLSPQGDEVEP